jgi:hypothetical protein
VATGPLLSYPYEWKAKNTNPAYTNSEAHGPWNFACVRAPLSDRIAYQPDVTGHCGPCCNRVIAALTEQRAGAAMRHIIAGK